LFRHFHAEDERYELLSTVPYGTSIRRAAEHYSIDGLLLASMVEVESSFDPQAVSYRGAVGLMQLMPTTAVALSLEDLHDPDLNVDRGARYLRYLLDLYDGDLELALAAYNAGPGNVRRYGGIPPFRETQNYVQKVLSLYVGHHQVVWQDSEAGELLVGRT
jgi:soluble lytic murein transglycosylase-like protein